MNKLWMDLDEALLDHCTIDRRYFFVGIEEDNATYITWLHLDGILAQDESLFHIVSVHSSRERATADQNALQQQLDALPTTKVSIFRTAIEPYIVGLQSRSSIPLTRISPSVKANLYTQNVHRLPGYYDRLGHTSDGYTPAGATMVLVRTVRDKSLVPPFRITQMALVDADHNLLAPIARPDRETYSTIEMIWREVRVMYPDIRLHLTICGRPQPTITFDLRLFDKVFTDQAVREVLHTFYRRHSAIRAIINRPPGMPSP